jgi:hypothetical protein
MFSQVTATVFVSVVRKLMEGVSGSPGRSGAMTRVEF